MKPDTKPKTQTISVSEFARQMGVNEKTIRDSIKLGKISKGVILVRGKSKILPEIAKKEFQAFRIGLKAKPVNKPKDELEKDPESVNNKMTYAEAQRVSMVLKAKLLELELAEKEKTLVNKAEVFSQLFEFGQTMKTEFENMPLRVGHRLVGLDANKISTILAREVYDSLTRLTSMIDELNIVNV
jgi:hypothetical protein